MNSGSRPRVLVYSQDGLGLGHLRRTSSPITELVSQRPGACVLSVSDSPLGKFFSTPGEHDYLKLPSIRKAGPGEWHPVSLPMPFDDVLRLRRELLRTAAVAFAPDLLLVDHMPHGAMGELVPTLEALRRTSTRVVLGLRDILDAPHVVQRRWRLEGAFEALIRYYDEVLVYGSRDVFDVARHYRWPAEAARLLHYCGYVCPSETTRPDGARLRARYLRGQGDASLVVATAGGGADAYPLMRALLTAAPRVLARRRAVFVVITGPLMAAAEQAELRRLADGLPVTVRQAVHDVPSHLAAADLVVSMAGYNTTTETVRLRRPALLVPPRGPSAEQRTRARLFAERGWVRWLDPARADADRLAAAVLGALDEPRIGGVGAPVRHRFPPPLDGRRAAVARLLELLDAGGASGRALGMSSPSAGTA